MKNKDFISIIIITLNEEENIGNILSDLSKQTYDNFEIIVSDSNSTDSTEGVVNSWIKTNNKIKFVNCGKTIGPSYGRNYGVKFAKFERLIFLDADSRIYDVNYLKKFIKIVNDRKIDAGSKYLGATETTGFKDKIGYSFMNIGFFITQFFSPTAVGAAMFSTKKVHNEINGFREDVKLCEDCDYVRDARRKKFKVRMIPLKCGFSNRRLEKDGTISTGAKYLKANMIRFVTGKSIQADRIKYNFGEYDEK